MTPFSILDALADPNLFGLPALGFQEPSWSRWRVFLKALFGLRMTPVEAEIFHHHTGRDAAPAEPFREACLVIGRRGGKSRVLALIAVYLATLRDWSAFTAPGEALVIAVIAADRKQARLILGYAIGLLRNVALLEPLIDDELVESVRLSNNVNIEVHTGKIASPRGRTFIAVLCDETAFWRSEDSANPDEEVIRSVRPGLATIPGSMLLMAGSPYRKAGVLWNAFKRHWGHDGARTLVWRGTTLEMNPSMDAEVVAMAYEDDPQAARAEWGAEFRDDISGFVTPEAVAACVLPGRLELPPAAGIAYRAFVDPSGGSADAMTLAIGHCEGEHMVLDAMREMRPPFSPEAVVENFAALLHSYGVATVWGDRYGGEWPRERFRVHGIAYHTADKTKSDYYQALLPLLNSGRAALLDLPRLSAQLCALERRTARGGRDSIDHAPGAHDDVANAVAGCLVDLDKPEGWVAQRLREQQEHAERMKTDRRYALEWQRNFETRTRIYAR